MKNFDNWGHVYGMVFNEIRKDKFDYKSFINSLIEAQKRKTTYFVDNEVSDKKQIHEVVFISKYKEFDEGYSFLIGRTNEEISKTKIDTKTFNTEDIEFLENEQMSDYTHIFISKKNISKTTNSFFLLLEKNQRIQIGIIKKLIGNIIGYKSLDDKDKSLLYIGALMQSDYIKKLMDNEILGKSIIINETNQDILDLPDNDDESSITKVTQIAKYKSAAKFLNSLNFLLKNPKAHENRDILLIVDDGKNKNKKIAFDDNFTKYVPFFQLPFYVKSTNKDINEKITDKFIYVVNNNEYETI